MTTVRPGSERLLADPVPYIAGSRVGLLTNPSGIGRDLRTTIERFVEHPGIGLVALFGPEHGVRGEAQAGEHVAASRDRKTGLPIHSLYGDTRSPTTAMLDGVDAIVVDLQDIGVRYTTYLSTLAYLMSACAGHETEVIILDRPNPLGGTTVRGNILDEAFASFVGVHAMPILHGLTIGEFGRLWARDRKLPEPTVVPMSGWERDWYYDETSLPWVLPSPNLPTLDSVLIYPATCLVEGTNLSEGRGTTRPFEMVGAPWIEPDELAAELRRLDAPGVAFRPVYFTPAFSKHAGKRCGGVQIHILERGALESVDLGIMLLHVMHRLAPDRFTWLPPADGRHFVDLLCGTDQVRQAIDTGADPRPMLDRWKAESEAFERSRAELLLY